METIDEAAASPASISWQNFQARHIPDSLRPWLQGSTCERFDHRGVYVRMLRAPENDSEDVLTNTLRLYFGHPVTLRAQYPLPCDAP